VTQEFREEAEKHWQFIEKLLDVQVSIEKVHYLYVEAMVHGFKHSQQTKVKP
jgi:hypothetical protein